MKLLERLLGRPSKPEDVALYYYVRGKKCGAATKVRINKHNDLSRDDDDNFIVRKFVVDGVCYGTVELELRFDQNYKELSRTITGGEFITKEEFETEEMRNKN
jgi:hypothetical protein